MHFPPADQSHSLRLFNSCPNSTSSYVSAAFSWQTRIILKFLPKPRLEIFPNPSLKVFSNPRLELKICCFVRLLQSWFNFDQDTPWRIFQWKWRFFCIRVKVASEGSFRLQWIASGRRLLLGGTGVRQQDRRIACRQVWCWIGSSQNWESTSDSLM